MEADIPSRPNPFLKQWLLSPDCVRVMREAGTIVRDVYRAVVMQTAHHPTGRLAASARVQLGLSGDFEGTTPDRIVADVIVGEGTPRGGYGASHEYGIGIHPRSRVPPTIWMPQQPVDDFVRVLAIVDSMSR